MANAVARKNSQRISVEFPGPRFEMFRLIDSSREVGISPNTLRKFNKEKGLPLYKLGKIVFASRSELAELIKAQPGPEVGKNPIKKVAA